MELSSSQIIQTLLTAQLIPIGLGMAINHFNGKWAEALLQFVPKIGQVGLVTSVILIVGAQAKLIIDLGLLPNLAVFLFIVVCLFVGDVMMIGETSGSRRSLGISTAIRNVALGLLIVNSNYPGTPAVAIVLVFGVLSMVVAFAYGKLLGGRDLQTSEA